MAQSGFLKVALVGPTDGASRDDRRLGAHTVAVAQHLADAGHDVTLVSWSAAHSGFPRTVRSLARNRPDTWVRTGRRLRGYDAVVIVHTGAAMVPLHLALLTGAGVGRRTGAADGGPRGVLLCDALLPVHPRAASRNLVSSVLSRVHGVLVHHREEAPLAARLGASRVYAVEEPERAARPLLRVAASAGPVERPAEGLAPSDLTAPWAAYVGAIEALAAPEIAATDLAERTAIDSRSRAARLAGTAAQATGSAVAATARLVGSLTPRIEISRADLPEWLAPTDVLDDAWQADEARAEARRLGLPRCRDGIAAWAALGALAAVVRVADDGRRAAVLVDESGPQSPFGRWAGVCGYAPVDLGLTIVGGGYDTLDVDPASLDVVTRLHPGGCDASDVDETISQAAWALRPGGILVLTVPLARPGTEQAFGAADVRAVVARAHEHGFVLVGDLDGELGRRMRAAGTAAQARPARREDTAYGLVRLTLRRR